MLAFCDWKIDDLRQDVHTQPCLSSDQAAVLLQSPLPHHHNSCHPARPPVATAGLPHGSRVSSRRLCRPSRILCICPGHWAVCRQGSLSNIVLRPGRRLRKRLAEALLRSRFDANSVGPWFTMRCSPACLKVRGLSLSLLIAAPSSW